MTKFRNEDEARAWVMFCSNLLSDSEMDTVSVPRICDEMLEQYRVRIDDQLSELEPVRFCQYEDCDQEPHWCEDHVKQMLNERVLGMSEQNQTLQRELEKCKADLDWHKTYVRPPDDPNNPRKISLVFRELDEERDSREGYRKEADGLRRQLNEKQE